MGTMQRRHNPRYRKARMDRIMQAVGFIKAICDLQMALNAAKSRAMDSQPATHKSIVIDLTNPPIDQVEFSRIIGDLGALGLPSTRA